MLQKQSFKHTPCGVLLQNFVFTMHTMHSMCSYVYELHALCELGYSSWWQGMCD